MFYNPSTPCSLFFFFFNDTATTEIYTLSLHDALPISPWQQRDRCPRHHRHRPPEDRGHRWPGPGAPVCKRDRKSTRLNSSHVRISYAVFCLKKKKKTRYARSHCSRVTKSAMQYTQESR